MEKQQYDAKSTEYNKKQVADDLKIFQVHNLLRFLLFVFPSKNASKIKIKIKIRINVTLFIHSARTNTKTLFNFEFIVSLIEKKILLLFAIHKNAIENKQQQKN